MLKTAGEAGEVGEAGDVKTGWVRLSTSAPLRLITSGEAGERRASVVGRRRRSPRASGEACERRPGRSPHAQAK